MSATGSFQGGVNYINEAIDRRFFSNDPNMPSIYEKASQASFWSILKIYLEESYFSEVYIPYFAIMIFFAIVSAIYLISNRIKPGDPNQTSKGLALIATTWFSLLSPLGWYIIFKSVAYFHTHMNYLPWHMPFTLFGFGMCGFVIETLFSQLKQVK